MAKTRLVQCKFCSITGRSKWLWRGSKTLERNLYLALLVFGPPLYTYWRWKGRKEVCAYCESENIVEVPEVELPEKVRQAEERDKKEIDLGHEEHRF